MTTTFYGAEPRRGRHDDLSLWMRWSIERMAPVSRRKPIPRSLLVTRMVCEHVEIQAMLDACLSQTGSVNVGFFEQFRVRTLRHMSVEETVLAAALEARLPEGARFRNALAKDHAAIVALCVPTPNPEWLEDLRGQLAFHNREEEAEGGFYQLYARYVGDDPAVLAAVQALRPLMLPPFRDGPGVADAIRDILYAAGITRKR